MYLTLEFHVLTVVRHPVASRYTVALSVSMEGVGWISSVKVRI